MQALFRRQFHQRAPLCGGVRQWLFGKHMFPGFESSLRNLEMRIGNCEVHHNIHVFARQQLLDRQRLNAKLRRPFFCIRVVRIGTSHQL